MPVSQHSAARMVGRLCRLMIGPGYLEEIAADTAEAGITDALRQKDADHIYDHVMLAFSMQGISDDVAYNYIVNHGNATRAGISVGLAKTRCACTKLAGFVSYTGCRYRKTAMTCARPQHLRLCPVRKLPLRKGLLNVQAHSLHFFLRDICQDDVAGFIDRIIEESYSADWSGTGDTAGTGKLDTVLSARTALIGEFSRIDGVSAKLANMVLAGILLGGRPEDMRWRAVGASMRAIDVLVHKFLDRSGILAAFGLEHRYGPRCYRADGCDGVIGQLAAALPMRDIDPDYPDYFPRLAELAIWRFAAGNQHGICRAQEVGKGKLCSQHTNCPVAQYCARGGRRKVR